MSKLDNKEAQRIFKLYRKEFTELFGGVKTLYRELAEQGKGHRGHGFDHDVLVAGYVILIAGGDTHAGKLAWVAAMLHSIDRLFHAEPEKVEANIARLLSTTCLEKSEIGIILQAVREHNGPNQLEDSEIKVILQDADRLANLGPLLVIRSGQHYPNIPAIEMNHLDGNPGSTFKNPRSCRDDVAHSLEWETCPKFGLRTASAKELARPYLFFLRLTLELLKQPFQETGTEELEN